MKRFAKSINRVVAGVCGGIANSISADLDPLIIRLLWGVFSFFNPMLILVYLVLAVAMPNAEASEAN